MGVSLLRWAGEGSRRCRTGAVKEKRVVPLCVPTYSLVVTAHAGEHPSDRAAADGCPLARLKRRGTAGREGVPLPPPGFLAFSSLVSN